MKQRSTARLLLGLCALLFVRLAAADVLTPNAGSLLQDLKSNPELVPRKGAAGLTLPPQSPQDLPPTDAFEVKQLVITGNTVFDTATLHGLVAFVEGKRLTLTELGRAIGAITDYYRSAGYPLARALIPAQTILDGVVRIDIIEARVGAVTIENNSGVRTESLASTLTALRPGDVIRQDALERGLLFLSDVVGIKTQAILRPGEAVGTSDLAVTVEPGPNVRAEALTDNSGSRYTGRDRFSANFQWLNPLHRGDVLGLNALSSGSGLNYARLSYEAPVNGQGGFAGLAASTLQYNLGDSAASLHAHGSAQQGSVWLRQSLLRSAVANVGLRLQFDPLTLRDAVDSVETYTNRHIDLWNLELQADATDLWFTDSATMASLAVRSGYLGFDNAVAERTDALTAKTSGAFSLWSFGLTHTKALGPRTRLDIIFSGQWALGNLDASQKFSLGGSRNVRAYQSGVLSGDTGQSLSVELRQTLSMPFPVATGGLWQVALFADYGQVMVNQNPWATGSNDASIGGAGIGLEWSGPNQWHAKVLFASAVGTAPSLLNNSDAKRDWAWLELCKSF